MKNSAAGAAGLIVLIDHGYDFRARDDWGMNLEDLINADDVTMSYKQIDEVQCKMWSLKDIDEIRRDNEEKNRRLLQMTRKYYASSSDDESSDESSDESEEEIPEPVRKMSIEEMIEAPVLLK